MIAVGVTLFFTTRHTDDTDKSTKVDEHKLVDLNSADVTKLAITGSDGTRTVLERKDGKWNLTEPVMAAAKTFEVDDLVRALTDLKSKEKVDSSKKASGGLDKPPYVVELTTRDGKKTKFSFGDKSSVGDSLYVQVNDSATADVVGNGIYATLEKPASTYRELRLVNTPATDVKQLTIAGKGGTIRLAKAGADWTFVEPAGIPADQSAITDLLSSLTTLEASEFVDAPNARVKNSFNRPKVTVSLGTQVPTTQPAATQSADVEIPGGQTIRFGGFKDVLNKDVYISLNNKEVALVSASSETAFEKTPLDLRDRNVLDLKPDRVSTIMLSMNRPATTQPTTRPAESHEFTIEPPEDRAAGAWPGSSGQSSRARPRSPRPHRRPSPAKSPPPNPPRLSLLMWLRPNRQRSPPLPNGSSLQAITAPPTRDRSTICWKSCTRCTLRSITNPSRPPARPTRCGSISFPPAPRTTPRMCC